LNFAHRYWPLLTSAAHGHHPANPPVSQVSYRETSAALMKQPQSKIPLIAHNWTFTQFSSGRTLRPQRTQLFSIALLLLARIRSRGRAFPI
jgi:hypothetical protein